jgi:DNA-binding NarL/FixJ family response regulator
VCINEITLAATGGRKGAGTGLKVSQKPKGEPARRRGRILLVERHPLMRHAVAGWINHCPDLEVCAVAGGPAQAFHALERLHPDVVVSEIMQPQDLGFIRELHRRRPGLPILVFSTHDEALYGVEAREAGAAGYLMKAAGGSYLVQNICSVLRRRRNGPARSSRRG